MEPLLKGYPQDLGMRLMQKNWWVGFINNYSSQKDNITFYYPVLESSRVFIESSYIIYTYFTKQACRDESIVSLFFPPIATCIYIYNISNIINIINWLCDTVDILFEYISYSDTNTLVKWLKLKI